MIGLTIDPGMSNGLCLFEYDDNGFEIVERWQFGGGATTLDLWLDQRVTVRSHQGQRRVAYDSSGFRRYLDALVVEKFTPRQNEEFNLTLDSVEPLRGEGVLTAHKLEPFISWAEPSMQYFMGSSELPKAEKKRLAKVFLVKHDLMPTTEELHAPNPDDAVSATLHSVAYLRRIRHLPTMVQLFK